ncbi:MAG: flippase-like domain-containing protein [Deltaproteobacteria bacterium]|nr:flippase-like domain-containing protein [Deltaproteobacteria bacterium]
MTRATRIVHAALVLAGLGVFVALVHHVGPARLAGDLRRFGWAILGVVAFELLIDGCNTAAWRAILPPDSPVGFGRLYWVRQAGVAINQVTPTATVGGEVVKTLLLRPYLRAATSAASLVAARMSHALGQTILVLLGLSAMLRRIGDAADLRGAIVLTVVALAGGVLSFVWLQRRGIFARLANGLPRLGLAERLVARARAAALALDGQLAAFYRERPGAFAASIAWHLLGQLVGLFQLSFILTTLGIPASIATCLAIEAFALVLDSAAFLVPGRVGAQEAGRVLVFTTFGLSATTGLAVAVIVRLNQLAVVALGLAAYAVLSAGARAPNRA